MKRTSKDLKNILKKSKLNISQNVDTSEYTTTKLGGKAKYLLVCKKQSCLTKAFKLFKKLEVPVLVIGSGSNILVSDRGFEGLVIVNKVREVKKDGELLTVSSGMELANLISTSCEEGLTGLENLAGIPGTVGGAIYGNAGAYGSSISDHLLKIKIFDGKKLKWVSKKDCAFSYRESIFKKTKPVVLEAVFKLERSDKKKVRKKILTVLRKRTKKYSGRLDCPGSFFKNIEVKSLASEVCKRIPKNKIVYGKVPAGYLLESIGAKGIGEGKIKVSDKHANFLINHGGKAKDYYALSLKLRNLVFEKYGIKLEPEVQLIGFEHEYKYKRVAILGLGLEGIDLVNYLLDKGALITVFDKKEKQDLNLKKIDVKKVEFVTGKDYLKNSLENFDVVFRSPGVYRYLPKIVKAEKKGVEISSATRLFFDLCPAKIIGVTGTKGKGTTSSLIYQILKNSQKKTCLAGNIGYPYLQLLDKLTSSDWVVLELSSFQLIDLKKSPHIAVLLNITQDHMDWHSNSEEYIDAKKKILINQLEKDFAVVNDDYRICRSFMQLTSGKVYKFSKRKVVNGGFVKKGNIMLAIENKKEFIGKTDDLLLKGRHNWENILAAICAARLAEADLSVIKKSVFTFKGLEHRLEFVGEFKGIGFYNDSFATGPQSTIAAVKAFQEPITLILGGYDKGLDYSEMVKVISKRKNISNLILIGDLAGKLEQIIKKSSYKGKVFNLGKLEISKIVKKCFKLTSPGGVVILSPAAASFDMFENYKKRGLQFKKVVYNLTNIIK